MKYSVIVTGAHGFLGRYVAKTYGQAGFYVIGIGAWLMERF